MGRREERIGRNETLFREVNERIRDVNEVLPPDDEAGFLCECGSAECAQQISLTLREYEEVRAESTRFVVAPGHEVTSIESVVASNDRFTVVEKHDPDAAEVAVRSDPR